MSLPLIPRYILLWRKQMVTVLPGCAMRNLCVAKAIFLSDWKCWNGLGIPDYKYWEIMLSQRREHWDKKEVLFAISLQRYAAALSGKTMERVAQEPSPVVTGERQIPPEGPVPAAAWLCGWTRHARQREDICSMTQRRLLGANAPKQSKWPMRLSTARVRKNYYSHIVIHEP